MRITLLHVSCLLSFTAAAQVKEPGYKEYFEEGTYLLIENQVEKACRNFEKAYEIDSSNANINYLLGTCYLQLPMKKDRAEAFLARSVKNVSANYRGDDASEKAAAPIAHLYYGQALHINYKFDEAIRQYEAFRKFVSPKDKDFLKLVDKEVATSKLAKEMVARPLNVQITNLGDSLNSEWPEYSAVLSGDERTIIYTTRRPSSTGGIKNENGQYFEDIVVAYRDDNDNWTKPVSLGSNVNSIGHEASINLTPDGQTLIVFKNDEGKSPQGNGNIYYTTFDGKSWSPLQEFGEDVNSEYWESHACLSADGNVLFFSSERPGGYGGKDIYRCVKLPNGKWSKALNMGNVINSEYDEDGGFIHPDGKTFYFASNGPLSMGGYDIMYATLDEENRFSNVTNIGYPINTTDDDIFYVTSPDGKRGYFSSAQSGGYGDKDIYRITIAETRERFLALFRGQIMAAEGEQLPDNIQIIVTDKQSHEIIGTYRPKPFNGTFSTILPPGREYNFSYQTDNGEEFYNEDVYVPSEVAYQEINRAVSLEPVKLGGKVKVKQKAILLNVLVYKSSKNRKPVIGSKLVVQDSTGVIQLFTPDSLGQVKDIILESEKKYRVYAEYEGKQSAQAEISTMGISTAKLMNQVIYLEGKPEKLTSKELLLDILVKAAGSKKPVPEATVVITDADGEKREVVTDTKGQARKIELSPETSYQVYATIEDNVSETLSFTTSAIAEGKTYSETLVLEWVSPEELAASERGKAEAGSQYHYTYKYGSKNINEKEKSWLLFIDYIVNAAENRPEVTVYIHSSASRVPTRLRGGNKELAELRAKNFEALVRKNLENRAVDMSRIKFVRSASVQGPGYRGDLRVGRKKYEKYQYVRGTVK